MSKQDEEQEYLANESAKAIADNEAQIEMEHQRELAEQDELLLTELREIVLSIRQYLCNTEFAPEPFTKPINPDKLTVEFPHQILVKVKQHYEPKIMASSGILHPESDFEQKRLDRPELREALAELEHEQWIKWSQAIAPEVSRERYERWAKLWIPYSDLSEEQKNQDRVWADKSLALIPDNE